MTRADALTGTVTMTANRSQIVVGNTVTYTVKVSATKPLGVFQYNLEYNSSYLSLTKGEVTGAPVFTGTEKSKTYTFTFKAKKAGSTTVKFKITGGYAFDQTPLTLYDQSKTLKIITQQQLENSYSKNNNLKSLSVNNYSLSPGFSQNVTSYTVTLPPNTEKITVQATKADSTASIEGTGTIPVVDGNNTIKIKVTAQNGSTKTYTINAIVQELDPINVTIADQKYTLIRKDKLLTPPNQTFVKTKVSIDNNEIPALHNEQAKIYLVGLKDTEGITNLYIYDQTNNSYHLYNQSQFEGLLLYIEDKAIPQSSKTTITYQNQTISAYKLKDDYLYFYAINLNTGQEHIYRYDQDEKTVQKYLEPQPEPTQEITPNNPTETKTYKIIIIGLLALLLLTYFIILINLIIRGRKEKKKRKKNAELNLSQITTQENDSHSEIASEVAQPEPSSKMSDEEIEKIKADHEEELDRIKKENTNEVEFPTENEVNELINNTIKSKSKKKKNTKKNSSSKKKEIS